MPKVEIQEKHHPPPPPNDFPQDSGEQIKRQKTGRGKKGELVTCSVSPSHYAVRKLELGLEGKTGIFLKLFEVRLQL